MSFKLEIPKPCSEDWSKMKIGLHSRFCENCEKDVMDFTGMSREEILRYVLTNHNKQLCARLYPSQVDFTHVDPWIVIEGLSEKQRKSNLPFYILSISALMMAGCGPGDMGINGAQKPDTVFVGGHGDSLLVEGKIPDPDTSRIVIMGDICISPDQTPTIGINYRDHADSLPKGEIPVHIAEVMPEFPGGAEALVKFVKDQIKYPEWEQKENIQGLVIVTFVVDKDGKIRDPRILKTVQGSKNFNAEVIRIMTSMPNWKPGENHGKKVAVQYNLPVKFSLK